MYFNRTDNPGNYSSVKSLPWFIIISAVVFIAAIFTTIYYVQSMADEMTMPGGWKMSMMWMRMPGETWLSSTFSFSLMWLAMMIAMMIPSALPVFLKTKQQWPAMCYTVLGYFAIWLLAGLVAYFLGIIINNAAMRSASFSHLMPLISGIALIAAAAIQFTRWKTIHLMRCRSVMGCITSNTYETGFTLGCKQGKACCTCCAGLMAAQLIFGIMNPLVMVVISITITAEKLVAKPKVIVYSAGATGLITGLIIIARWILLQA